MNAQVQNEQRIEDTSLRLPTTYFDFVKIVGSEGRYQTTVFILFSINWFLCGFIILQTAFIFMNKTFNCSKQGLLIDQCRDSLCSLKQSEYKKLAQTQKINSLATQFGPYLCENQFYLNYLKSIEYVGITFGYLFFFYFTDNYGRKFSIILSWSCACFGVILLVCAQNMLMAVIGLFFAGAGCQTSIKINITTLNEFFNESKWQPLSVALQIFLGSAGMIIALLYYLIEDWRKINIIFLAIPSILLLISYIYYLEQTPVFLVKKQRHVCLKALNRIGSINLGKQDLVRQEHIVSVLSHQINSNQSTKKINAISLFKFQSLRLITILASIVFMALSYLYMIPYFAIDRLGLNPYINSVVISLSQMLAYPISMIFIEKINRRMSGIVCFLISAFLSLLLIIVQKPKNCNSACFYAYLDIICVFITRFMIAFYYSIFFVYLNELYPLKARGTGFGFTATMASLCSISGNILIGYFYGHKLNPQFLSMIFGIIAVFALFFLPQTSDKPLKIQIQEIEDKNKGQKQKNQKGYQQILEQY